MKTIGIIVSAFLCFGAMWLSLIGFEFIADFAGYRNYSYDVEDLLYIYQALTSPIWILLLIGGFLSDIEELGKNK